MKIKWKNGIVLKSEDMQIKILAFGLVLFLIVILIPLFQISHYNSVSVDDYSFSAVSVPIWQESHSVWKVLCSQIQYSYHFYQTWQGTYFSGWLLPCLLGFFSQNEYYMGTYLALGGLVVCELFSFTVILRKVFRADYGCAIIIAVSCISMQILLTTVPVEAFYWFTSAIVYTFIYALTVLLTACLVLLYHGKFSKPQLILMSVLLTVLNVAVAGSNYITGLGMVLIHLFSCMYFFVRRHRYRFMVLGQSIFFLIAFFLNVAAPGNQNRQNSSNIIHLSAMRSILLACKEAAEYLMKWTIFPDVLLGLLLIPIILRMVKKKDYRYPCPVLISFLSFGLFAAQFTPTIYAQGITGAGRVQNLYRFSMFIYLYGNEIYWIGWAWRRWCEHAGKKQLAENVEGKEYMKVCWVLPAWTIGGFLLLWSLYVSAGNTLTSYNAWNSLRRGEAQQYYKEYQERRILLEDDTQKEVSLPPYTLKPYLLYFDDITEDSSNWANQAVANWYHKDSVSLQK